MTGMKNYNRKIRIEKLEQKETSLTKLKRNKN